MRHLMNPLDFSIEELEELFCLANDMEKNPQKYSEVCKNKSYVTWRLKKWRMTKQQMILLDGDYVIDDELSLFTVSKTDRCHSQMNDVLYERDHKDTFSHEQNLIIAENKTALIMGCGHAGVVNIMDKASSYHPDLCVGGFHLFNPVSKKSVPAMLLDDIAAELQKYQNTDFYTCHCTGKKAFRYLSGKMKNLHYISCGERIVE